MNRRHRLVASLFAVFVLLYAQLAVSAHACVVTAQSMAAEMTSAHDCCNEDGDADSNPLGGNLCVEHCNYGAASFSGGHCVPDVIGQLGSALRVDSPDTALAANSRPAWLLATPAAPPPAAILFGVLRI